MARRDDVIAFMNEKLEIGRYTDGLPIGLQIEGRDDVGKIATGVSACIELFERAIAWGADMIVVHHGMFWDGSDRVVRGPLKRRLKMLLDADVSLVGYHLPLDANFEVGNNVLIAEGLGLVDVEPWGTYKDIVIGARGRLDPAMRPDAFVARGREFFGREPLACFLEGPDAITTVGVMSGGAWHEIDQATRSGLDCYIDGSADEPVAYMAREEGIHFIAFGHYATERVGVRRLGDVVADACGVEVQFFDVENPL